MSVTVYVDGWADMEYTMVKAYMDEVYPDLDAESFAPGVEMGSSFVEEGTGRIYDLKRQYAETYPEINLTEGNLRQILALIGMNHLDSEHNALSGNNLDRFYRALLKAQNGKAKSRHDDEVVRNGNFIDFLPGETYLTRQLTRLMELIQFARQKGVGIYWA